MTRLSQRDLSPINSSVSINPLRLDKKISAYFPSCTTLGVLLAFLLSWTGNFVKELQQRSKRVISHLLGPGSRLRNRRKLSARRTPQQNGFITFQLRFFASTKASGSPPRTAALSPRVRPWRNSTPTWVISI